MITVIPSIPVAVPDVFELLDDNGRLAGTLRFEYLYTPSTGTGYKGYSYHPDRLWCGGGQNVMGEIVEAIKKANRARGVVVK